MSAAPAAICLFLFGGDGFCEHDAAGVCVASDGYEQPLCASHLRQEEERGDTVRWFRPLSDVLWEMQRLLRTDEDDQSEPICGKPLQEDGETEDDFFCTLSPHGPETSHAMQLQTRTRKGGR